MRISVFRSLLKRRASIPVSNHTLRSQTSATDTRKPHPLRTIDGARKIPRSVMRNPLSFYMAPGGWASSHSIKRSIPRNSLWLPHEFKYHFPRPSCSDVLLDGCTLAT
jgi:hypothetical protein